MLSHDRRRHLVAPLAILGSLATGAGAQVCDPTALTFTKSLMNLTGHPANMTIPGDLLRYQIKLCLEPGAAPCRASIDDAWDAILGAAGIDPADLDLVPDPLRGCGGTLCEKGSTTGPVSVLPTTRCGLDCQAPVQDVLALVPDPSNPDSLLNPGECYYWTIEARVTMSPTTINECLCDRASSTFGTGSLVSHDPFFVNLEVPPGPGCGTNQICTGSPVRCDTCVKVVSGGANLNEAKKCFDTSSPCVTAASKQRGETVRWELLYVNSGSLDAAGVTFFDDPRTLGPACYTSPLPTATCVADPATCGAATCTVDQQPDLANPFRASMNGNMPPGCRVTISLEAAISTSSTGTCCNQGRAGYVDPAMPVPVSAFTNRACFTLPGFPDLAVTKVLDPPGQRPEINQPVTYQVTVANLGPGTALTATLVDRFDPNLCLAFAGCGDVTCDPGSSGAQCTLCAPTVAPPGFTYGFSNLPQGESITFRITATAKQSSRGCVNEASVDDGVAGDANDQSAVPVPVRAYTVTKTAAPSLVPPGSDTTFTILIENTLAGAEDLLGCTISDDVAAAGCMTLKSCDSSIPAIPLTCNPPGGFSSAAPFDVPVGQTQEVVITVTAGSTETTCTNTVEVLCAQGHEELADGDLIISSQACLVSSLGVIGQLLGAKAGADIDWEWQPDPAPPIEYHLNTVTAKALLTETPAKRAPVGNAGAPCSTAATSCTESDGIASGGPLVYYQALSACGRTGQEEGPVCESTRPCPP